MLDDRREAFYDTHFEACRLRYKPFNELSSRLLVELVLTCDIATQISTRDLAKSGLSKSTFNILLLLLHGPRDGMQLHDLGELLLVSRANITGLIDHLEKKGYVTREVPPNDRRIRYAKITAKAEALIDSVMPLHLSLISDLLGDVTTDEQIELRRLLHRLRSSLLHKAQEKASRQKKVAAARDHGQEDGVKQEQGTR